MSLANQKRTFKIGDLARIALGAEELTSEHLNILQNIFLVLLRKLNCYNETVKIKGLEAECLQKLIDNCPTSCQYNFQFDNLQNFKKKFNLLEELARKTQEIDTKLKQHFEQIRNCNRTDIFAASKWHIYASPVEDLGALCSKENRKYWFLIQSSIFNNELRRCIVPQIVNRFKKFEDKIEKMQQQLSHITKMSNETDRKLKCVESVIKNIEDIRSVVNSEEIRFHDTITEVDEMLSCKLHRVTVPALKKYLEKCFDNVNMHLKVLQAEAKMCPPAKAILIGDKKTCLSCCRYREFSAFGKFKDLKSIDETIKCSCCNLLKDLSIMEKIERLETLDLMETCISGKSEQKLSFSEYDTKRPNNLKFISQNQENVTARTETMEDFKRKKVLGYGPLF